jgi:hypothetical protein
MAGFSNLGLGQLGNESQYYQGSNMGAIPAFLLATLGLGGSKPSPYDVGGAPDASKPQVAGGLDPSASGVGLNLAKSGSGMGVDPATWNQQTLPKLALPTVGGQTTPNSEINKYWGINPTGGQ